MEEFDVDVEGTLDGFSENPIIPDIPSRIETTLNKEARVESTDGELEVIGTITSAAYGGFTKILSLLTGNMGKTDIISIEEGKLSTISGGGYLYCDLSVLFGENNFDIIDPQYSIKLLKLISGGDQVTFVDDDANSKYLISSLVEGVPQINITLPKPDPSMNPRITKPNLGEKQEAIINIDPDLVNTITTAEKNLDSQYFILEINEVAGKDVITSIATDYETFKFNFKEANEDSTKYKLFNPFPIPKPDDIEFELYKTDTGDLWVKTTSEVGMAKIEYNEKLAKVGLFDSFSL